MYIKSEILALNYNIFDKGVFKKYVLILGKRDLPLHITWGLEERLRGIRDLHPVFFEVWGSFVMQKRAPHELFLIGGGRLGRKIDLPPLLSLVGGHLQAKGTCHRVILKMNIVLVGILADK